MKVPRNFSPLSSTFEEDLGKFCLLFCVIVLETSSPQQPPMDNFSLLQQHCASSFPVGEEANDWGNLYPVVAADDSDKSYPEF